ncbi:MAG: hypothetical protein MK125_06680, partial [Dehalococcoidia bacterium]|nr:hypothetical protein [Dehalococcoidia bacterium]
GISYWMTLKLTEGKDNCPFETGTCLQYCATIENRFIASLTIFLKGRKQIKCHRLEMDASSAAPRRGW